MMIWNGSIEIGVTACDPENTKLPASATNLIHGSWIMTGSCLVQDGEPILELYGTDLSNLEEGHNLGVYITSKRELIFYINGVSQGIAATNIPPRVFAVINMYGNCIQVSIVPPISLSNEPKHELEINNDYGVEESSNSLTTNLVANLNVNLNVNVNLPKNQLVTTVREDRLRFHERLGNLVKLSNNARTAERKRPLDEFNNGVIMTHRPLRDNELFDVNKRVKFYKLIHFYTNIFLQIRIDRLVEK